MICAHFKHMRVIILHFKDGARANSLRVNSEALKQELRLMLVIICLDGAIFPDCAIPIVNTMTPKYD